MSPTMTTSRTQIYGDNRVHSMRVNGGYMAPGSLGPLDTDGLHGFHNGPQMHSTSMAPSYQFSGLQSPPPLPRMACIPLPSLGGGSINDLLERRPVPLIAYNITQAPSMAGLSDRYPNIAHRSFHEPATSHGATSITIRVPFSSKPVVVHRNGEVVTVGHILCDVYAALQGSARRRGIPLQHEMLFSRDQSFPQTGCYDERTLTAIVCGHTRWEGLAPSSTEPDVWVLNIR